MISCCKNKINWFLGYNISMGKFDIFNKFSSAVAVIDDNQEVVYRNNVFKRFFSDFTTLKSFSHPEILIVIT